MSEILTVNEADEVLGRLTSYGHVAVTGMYDSAQAPRALIDTGSVIRGRLHGGSALGEQRANLNVTFGGRGRSSLQVVTDGIFGFMSQLGQSIEPRPGESLKAELIWQRSGTAGAWHRDKLGIQGVVVLTNLQGSSEFRIAGADGMLATSYAVEPGITVLLDNDRHLLHRGVAGPGERAGLVLAREQL